MNLEENKQFTKKIESLVNPADVTAISFLGEFNKFLPLSRQRQIMKRGSRNVRYMGFIVDPYCFFLSYEITDCEAAAELLPAGYELCPASVFAEDAEKPLMVIGVFNARTSAFIGMRLEAYIIARRKTDGKPAWIIVDYLTDTNSYDPARGFSGYDAGTAFFTTNPYGKLLLDVYDKEKSKGIDLEADITQGVFEKLDRALWVEGNLDVNYGGHLQDRSSEAFTLLFDPALMKQALRIPAAAVTLTENSFFPDLINGASPLSCACFPYAQHYIINQQLPVGEVKNEEQLNRQTAAFLDNKEFKMMKGSDIKRPLLIGLLLSAAFNYALIIFLLIKVFTD